MAHRQLGASITGFTLYIFTVYSAIYGFLFFNEQLEYYHYLGTVLVFDSVYLLKKKVSMKKKLKEYLLELILFIPVACFSLLFIIFIFQRNLLYHPKENNYFGDELKVKIEKVKIETGDNFELLGWFHEKDLRNFKTIIFFHGNAGTLENRIHKINHFKEMNINLLIISWRGFSRNLGKPSEKGLYEDGESAINWLKGKGLKDNDIVLYGESSR